MDCPICLQEFEDSAYSLCCGHIFHEECIKNLAHPRSPIVVKCPLCNKLGATTIGEQYVRKIYLYQANPSTQAPSDSTVDTPLTHAIREKELALDNLSRSRVDTEHLKASNRVLQQQLSVNHMEEITLRRERDTAIANLARITAQNDALSARTRVLEEKEAEMALQMAQYSRLKEKLSTTFNSFQNAIQEHGMATQSTAGSTGSATQTTREPAVATSSTIISAGTPRNGTTSTFVQEIKVESNHAYLSRNIRKLTIRRTLPVAVPTPVVPTPVVPKPRVLKSGNDILWTGYGRPKHTAILECVSANGYHNFSGKGTNQYRKRYTCTVTGCGVVVSE